MCIFLVKFKLWSLICQKNFYLYGFGNINQVDKHEWKSEGFVRKYIFNVIFLNSELYFEAETIAKDC